MFVSYRKHAFPLQAFRRQFLSVVLFPIHLHPSPLQKTLAPPLSHLSLGFRFLSQSSPAATVGAAAAVMSAPCLLNFTPLKSGWV